MNKSDYKNVYVVIPAFNEEKAIGHVIDSVKKEDFENIIVVDDGSEDNTFEIAKSKNCVTLKHLINRGKGAATQTGMDMAKLLGAEATITIDGDGQHFANDIYKVAKPIINKECDIVVGSRLKSKKGVPIPLFKKVVNIIANWMVLVFYGVYVSDSQSGFRGYSRDALEKINTTQDKYEFESEVLHLAENYKLKIQEVPIKVRYTDYSKNKYSDIKDFPSQGLGNGIRMLVKMVIRSIMT